MGLPEYESDDEDEDNEAEAGAPPVSARQDRYVAALRSDVELMGGRLEINAICPAGRETRLPDGRWVQADAAETERPDPVRDRAVARAH
jgi:hypothetical protein